VLSSSPSALAMLLGESSRPDTPQAAVGPDLVVVLSLDSHGFTRLVQGLKLALVEVLVSELSVEAFDVAVLHGTPRLE
jgi:class 3 adenylate cyclase